MGEQVCRTIGEINLQSLLLIKYVLDPVIHTPNDPSLGKMSSQCSHLNHTFARLQVSDR